MINLLKNRISALFKQDLVSGTFYVFLGTTIANFLAFLLNLFFARRLSYGDYGTLSALLSIFTLAVAPASLISAIINKFVPHFIAVGENDKAAVLFRKISEYLLVLSIIVIILSFFSKDSIAGFLKISDPFLFLILAVTICANYLLMLNINFLNSLLRFKFISFSYIISGIAKIAFGVLMVYFGFRVYGGLGAVLALILVQYFLTLIPLQKFISLGKTKVSLPVKDVLIFSIPATVTALSLFSFVSVDIILVKHFLSATDAGFYGALSLIGRVIFYFTLPVPMVMFPLLVKKHAVGEKYNRLFYLALVIVLIPSVLITLFYFIFPDLTINLFLGGREYIKIAPYLGLFGIFLTIYSINNTFMNYFLSTGKTKAAILVLIFAILQIVGIYFFHNTFYQIISVSIGTSVLLLGSLSVFFLKHL